MRHKMPLYTETPTETGLESLLPFWVSTCSKVSIGGLTLNSVPRSVPPHPPITTSSSLPQLSSSSVWCSCKELKWTHLSLPTSSTLRRSQRRSKSKRILEISKPRKLKTLPRRPLTHEQWKLRQFSHITKGISACECYADSELVSQFTQ